jgi:4-amino-4-deoxy-L-arabinose transferase-like glycosyltransferase
MESASARPLPPSPLACLPRAWAGVLFPGASAAGTAGRVPAMALLLLLVLPGVLLYPWRSFHLLEPDEGRYAQIPREMLERGDWIVPTLQGEPYLDKPPLLYWLVMLSYSVFGPSAAAARLVPALAVHAAVLATYLLGRRSLGERPALWGAVLLAVSPGFMGVGRLLLLDGLLSLWVTLGLLTAFEAVRTGRLKWGWWLVAALACGLGVLTKGPIAVLLVAAPLAAYRWLMTAAPVRPAAARVAGWAAFAALALAVNVPWYAAACLSRPEFAGYFFWKHNVQRFLTPFDHLEPFWYYAPLLFAGLLPGTVVLYGFVRHLLSGGEAATGRPPEMGFWLLAGGWCVLFFSLSGSKLPTYILPAFPALSLALGVYLARVRWSDGPLWRGTVVAAAALLLALHAGGLPWYAEMRSPLWKPDVIAHYCGDPNAEIVCYPRNCDSVAFYLGRDDLRSVRSKYAADLARWMQDRPRTVVLFTHRHSLEALTHALPPTLRVTQQTSLRRTLPGWPLLEKLVGDTPWGLCDVAVVERVN